MNSGDCPPTGADEAIGDAAIGDESTGGDDAGRGLPGQLAAATRERLRQLPSVDQVLRSGAGVALLERHPRWAVVDTIRDEIATARGRLLRGCGEEPPSLEEPYLERRIRQRTRPCLRRVLNATGVVLHTNLGRAPLAARAIQRIADTAAGYSTLEYDVAARGRGSRHDIVRDLLCALTGAEAALVVSSNAGAVLLALSALAAGREVVVSRGELVEIGGGFRVPDVMRSSGARLIEVGTTNKTRLDDYLSAVGPETALLLKVHRSNFAIVGFTEEAAVTELAGASSRAGLLLMVDLGSGSLVQTRELGLPDEPTVQATVAAGADVVMFSGDKLLGGPQAGIIVGRRTALAAVAKHPMMRALRPDKLTLAGLEATLELYRDGTALDEVPVLRMLSARVDELQRRAGELMGRLGDLPAALHRRIVRLRSAVGGGALPLAEPESCVVALRHDRLDSETLSSRLALAEPALIGRICEGEVLLDVRTLEGDDLAAAARIVAQVVSEEAVR